MRSLDGLLRPMLVGLVIREALAPFTGHPFDFEIWARLGVFIQSGANPYSLLPYVPGLSFNPSPLITSISYPPLPAFIFGAAHGLYQLLGAPSAFVYYFILKQPMVFSDLLSAFLLYKLVSLKAEPSAARRAATFWIYFPFGIVISAVWGALDPLALMLILAAVYFLETHREFPAAGLLGLSIFLKLMPVIFLPVFLLVPSLSVRRKLSFTGIALAIPAVWTAIPFLALGWNPSGIYNAVSYQGSLPGFGGIGAFNFFSLLAPPPGPVATTLSLAWIPALAIGYAYAYFRRATLVEGLLITVLLFSVFRPTTPEQWALYPVAFLLIVASEQNWSHVLAIGGVATAFLLANNFLLVRFFAPVWGGALTWDQYIDNTSAFTALRYAIMLILSTVFVAEALSVVLNKRSFVLSKLEALRGIRFEDLKMPVGYVAVVSVAGGLLDYTATKMVVDWAPAFNPGVFLGLSWLSLYHIMLVAVFEVMSILIVLFSRRSLSESIGLFFLLTFLNFISSGFSLMLYRALDGAPILASTTIYLLDNSLVTERTFVVFADALGLIGIFYLKEIRLALTFTARQILQIAPRRRVEAVDANRIPAPA